MLLKNRINLTIILMTLICNINSSTVQCEQNKPITIFVHGTLFAHYRWFVQSFDCKLGLNLAYNNKKYVMGRLPFILNEASCQYPIETFYTFGWSGYLDFQARKDAARDLYHAIKDIKGPITVIGHSHGCNVAINLAQIAREHKDKNFKIDRLILLACPVQQVNAHLVKSKIFKKVFSLFSSADPQQIGDPQGLYKESKKLNKKVPFFSERTFLPSNNLIQAQIFVAGKSPSHNDFIFKRLLKRIPEIIDLLDSIKKDSDLPKIIYVNVPFNEQVHFTNENEVKFFTPRRTMKRKAIINI